MKKIYSLFVLCCVGISPYNTQAQVTGTKTIGTDYATLAAAITDLNTTGISGNVIINVPAGYTETAPVGGYKLGSATLNASTSASATLTITKNGTGASPVLTAFTGTSTSLDGIFFIQGTDYVTIDGINLAEDAANTTATQQMEWGYALVKRQNTAPFDGCQYVTIKNCLITLTRGNSASVGIYANNHIATSTSQLTITAAGDAMSNCVFSRDTLTNCTTGIVLRGYSTAGPLYDQNNTVGGSSITGNVIQNYAGASAGSGVNLQYQNNATVSYNNINNMAGGGVVAASTLYGVYVQNGTDVTVNLNNNTLNLTQGSNSSTFYGINANCSGTGTVNINSNTITASGGGSGSMYMIYLGSSNNNVNTNNNNFNNISVATNSTIALIYHNSAATSPNIVCSGNFTSGSTTPYFNRTGSGGTMYGYYNNASSSGGYTLISNNNFSNITQAGSATFYGVYDQNGGSGQNKYVRNCIFSNITSGSGALYGVHLGWSATQSVSNCLMTNFGTGSGNIYGVDVSSSTTTDTVSNCRFSNFTSTGGNVYGIYATSSGTTLRFYNDTMNTFVGGGSSSLVYGINQSSGTTVEVYKNLIYDLAATGTGSSVNAMYLSSGTETVWNNLVGDIRLPGATGAGAGTQLVGIYCGGGTAHSLYYNTVYINGSSTGANFGSSAVYAATSNVTFRSNIFINTSTPAGTGIVAAYRRSGTSLSGYQAASNNNLFYAGTPAANKVIMYDGTNTYQTLAAYKTAVGSRDASSVTENVPFQSVVGGTANFLKPSTTIATQVESGGANITGITDDMFGTIRAGNAGYGGTGVAPDLGAVEGDYIPLDLTAPAIAYTPLTYTCATGDRSFTATISDNSGVPTIGALIPRVYYKKGSGAWFSNPGVLTSGTGNSGTWTFTILASDLGTLAAGDVISYYVIAQDVASTPNLGSLPGGVVASSVTSITTPPTANTYNVSSTLSGTYNVGTGGDYATITAAVNAYNTACITGPVTFSLISPSYAAGESFPITINANSYASATNYLTIKPAAGINPTISGSAAAIIKLNGADYVTIDGSNTTGGTTKNLTISNTSTSASAAIWNATLGGAGNGADYNTIKNLTVAGGTNTTDNVYGILSGDGSSVGTSGDNNINFTVQNCNIRNAYYGISLKGTSALPHTGALITQDSIGSNSASTYVLFYGLWMVNQTNPTVTRNTIFNMKNTSLTNIAGIEISGGVTNALIERNVLTGIYQESTGGWGAYGIDMSGSGCSDITIRNNFISDMKTENYSSSSTTYNAFGIRASAAVTNLKIHYNSIAFSGNVPVGSSAGMSACMLFTTSQTGLEIKDNILSNTQTFVTSGSSTYLIYMSSAFAPTVSNYNDYSGSSSATTTFQLGYAGSNKANLASWQAVTSQDANSITTVPTFVSASDLHLQSVFANFSLMAGSPIAGVTTDIDGATRSSVNPIIGAHELIVPTCSGTPTAGTVTPSVVSACNPFTSVLSTSGTTAAAGLTYQWQSSPDSLTYTNIPGATNITYNASVSSSTYYRFTITCTSSAATDSTAGYRLVVNTPPAAISGISSLCVGSTGTLSNSVGGGSWTSSNGSVATIGSSSGIVSGIAGGGALISYTLPNGCSATAMQNVSPAPPLTVAAAPATICSGNTSSLTATSTVSNYSVYTASFAPVSFTPTGTFNSSSTTSGGNLDDGYFTVPLPFDVKIFGTTYTAGSNFYIVTNGYVSFTGSATSTSVGSMPNSGFGTVISVFGRDLNLNTAGSITYGTTGTTPNRKFIISYNSVPDYSTTNPEIGQIVVNETTGQIDLHVTTAQPTTHTLGVQNATGTTAATVPGQNSSSTAISSSSWSFVWPQASQYSWAPATDLSNSTIANPVSSSTTTVTYTVTGSYNGCSTSATTLLSVNPTPAAIAGTTVLCSGGTSIMTNTTPGGSWSSSVPAVATVDATGTVTGVGAGTTLISYTIGGCAATVIFTVNTAPGAFAGSTIICTGVSTTLTNAGGPGSWTSADATIASVGATSGIVTGVATGTTTISYQNGCGTVVTTSVNVIAPMTAISGSTSSCVASGNTLTNTTPGGTWSSSNTAVATIDPLTGVVTGVTAGNVIITYSMGSGCVAQTRQQYVNPAPPLTVNASPSFMCSGNTSSLTAASTVSNYTLVTIPFAPESFTPTGTFNSSSSTSGGSLDDGYFTVPLPFDVKIFGTTYAAGSNCYVVTNGYVSFTGSATSTSVGTLPNSSFGTLVSVFGRDLNLNTAGSITYGTTGTTPNRKFIISYNSVPDYATTNPEIGQIVISETTGQIDLHVTTAQPSTHTLGVQNATGTTASTVPGQNSSSTAISSSSWSFIWPQANQYSWVPATGLSNTAIANPVSSATTTVTYTVTGTYNGCSTSASTLLSVNPTPAAIAGTTVLCSGGTSIMTNTTPGGSWSSSVPAVATVDATGTVTGVGAGTTLISYTIGGCAATVIFTVNTAPGAFAGSTIVCPGLSTTLTNAGGPGTWTSADATIASVGGTSGIVTGVATGTTTISYQNGCGAVVTTSVNVIAPMTAISGSTSSCVASGNTLTNSTPGGTWSSSNTAVATIDPLTGVVTGVTAGNVIITYSVGSGCVDQTRLQYVNPAPPVTVGASPATICAGGTSTLSATSTVTNYTVVPAAYAPVTFTPTGTFNSSSTTSGGSLDDGYFTVPLPFDIKFFGTTYTAGTSCYLGTNGYLTFGSGPSTITIGTMPSSSFGAAISIFGRDLNLNTAGSITYGTTGTTPNRKFIVSYNGVPDYSTTNPEVGQITIAEGTGQIDLHITTAQPSSHTMGVQNSSATTAATVPGMNPSSTAVTNGSWSFIWPQASSYSWAPAASLSNSAIANPVATPTTTVIYTVSAVYNGCTANATKQVSVNPLPSAITGTAVVCAGLTTSLSSSPPGGTWTSSNTTVATVGSTGVVSGLVADTATISYTLGTGCGIKTVVTVNPLPGTITGTASVCESATTTLASTPGTGTWSSDGTSIAIVDPTSGVVTGVSAGFAQMTYTLPTSCRLMQQVTVNPVPTVSVTPTPVPDVCLGSATSLTANYSMNEFALMSQDFNAGLGAWTITNIDGSSDSYWQITPSPEATSGATGDGTPMLAATPFNYSSITNTLITSPSFSTVGYGVVTLSFNEFLMSLGTSDATVAVEYSADGGTTWNTVLDQIDTMKGSGAWSATSPEVSISLPAGALGQPNVQLRWNYNSLAGLWWNIDNIKVTAAQPAPSYVWSGAAGLSCTTCTSVDVTPTAVGANAYSVQATTSAGCVNSTTTTVNVNPLPSAIGGTLAVCEGLTTTATNTGGGTWAIATTSVATVDATTGIITGVSGGTVEITYTLPTGCTTTAIVTVNSTPATIGGTLAVCLGQTTSLTDADAGGSWTTSASSIADIDADAVVSGVAAGNATISYTLPTGCITTSVVTVNPLPAAIGGTMVVCQGVTTTLTNTGGGTWTSGATGTATVGTSSGIVMGVSAGIAPITYTLPTGCMTSADVTVNGSPAAITGVQEVCTGAATTLSDSDPGGSWASSAPGVAAVSTTGIVSGVAMGTATITYSLSAGCMVTAVVTVDPQPAPISGPSQLCAYATGTFTDGTPGGTWSSSTLAVATIDNTTGEATAVASGVTLITYTSAAGCIRTRTLTVNPLPAAITGPSELCMATTITLANTTAGGTWNSGAGAIATISSTGVLSGVSDGIASIVYTLPTGCATATSVTVNPLPSTIGGTTSVCVGQTTTLTNTIGGGTWSSGTPANALVDAATGIVTGVGAGSSLITYTLASGCSKSIAVAVNTMPAAITGATNVCQGTTATMATTSTGGVWTSSVTTVASINLSTGVVTGLAAGSTTISYTIPAGGCFVTRTITVDAMPAAFSGALNVCNGQTTTLGSTPTGGTWISSNLSVATVDASGVVSGLASGTSSITYSLSSGCTRSAIVSVNALPIVYNVTGGGNYCSGSGGVHIGLDNATGGVNYQLYSGTGMIGGPVAGATGMPVDFGFITPVGSYSVVATSATTGCSANMAGTATVSMTTSVPASVSFASSTGSDTVCSGLPVTFTASASNGGTTPVYQWKVNGIVISGATTNVFTHMPATGDVVVVNMSSSIACANPSISTATRALIVNTSVMPLAAISVIPGTTICAGTSATFNASALYGGSAPAYAWVKNGTTVAFGPSYTYAPANGDNIVVKLASNHVCVLADTVLSNVVTMTVNPVYLPTVSINVTPGTMVETGTSVTMTATVSNGGASPEYQWYIGSTAIAGATSSTFTYSMFADGDSVSCLVRGTGGCGLGAFNSVIMHVGATGVITTGSVADVRLMPNPNKGEFAVKGTLSVKADKEVAIEVTNMLGQVVYRTNAIARNGVVDTQIKLDNTLANGMYMLNLISGEDKRVFHFVLEQ